jgi:hypothetical protein
MSQLNFNLSFRVCHPSVRAETICSQLAMTPRFSHSVGDQRKTPKGTLLEGRYDQTYVMFPLAKKKGEWLDHELLRWCAELDRLAPDLLALKNTGGTLDFCVSISLENRDGGFELDASVIERVNSLGCGLAIDLYVGT